MSMLYTKPKGMQYTDLCIFFDDNMWKEDGTYDEVKCYQYLYCIVYMLALKKKLLRLYYEYDSFVMYATTKIFMGCLKKKKKGLPRIKNILDYTKSCLHFLKILWAKEEYTQTLNSERNENIDIEAIKNMLRENVSNQYNIQIRNAIINSFADLPNVIDNLVSNSHYTNDKILLENIKISCILSLYKTFILNPKMIKSLKSTNTNMNIFELNKNESITLFRLDENMRDTITLLCNKIRKEMGQRISKAISDNTLDTNTIDDILSTAWEASNHAKNSDNLDWEDNN